MKKRLLFLQKQDYRNNQYRRYIQKIERIIEAISMILLASVNRDTISRPSSRKKRHR